MLSLFFISSPLCIEVHLSADDGSVIEDDQQQTDESDTSPAKAGALELEIEVDDIEMADGEEVQTSKCCDGHHCYPLTLTFVQGF